MAGEDLTDVNFIVLYKAKTVTISGSIVADSQFFNSLRVSLHECMGAVMVWRCDDVEV